MAALEPLTDATAASFSTRILVPLSGLTLGRSVNKSAATIQLPQTWVQCSQRHCRIYNTKGTWFIHDLSRNGTHVGAEVLGKDVKRELKDGEELTLSRPSPGASDAVHAKWRFVIDAAPATAAAPAPAAATPSESLKRKSVGATLAQGKRPRPSSSTPSDNLTDQNTKLRRDIQAAFEEKQQLLTKIRQLTEELDASQAQLTEALDKAKGVKGLAELEAEVAAKAAEIHRLQELVGRLEGDKRQLTAHLEAERRDMEAATKRAAEEAARVKQEASHQAAEAEQRADALAKQLQTAQADCERLGAENKKLKADLKQEGARNEQAVADLRKQTKTLERQVVEIEQNWKAAQSREEFARMNLVAQGNVIADLQQTIANAQSEEAAADRERTSAAAALEQERAHAMAKLEAERAALEARWVQGIANLDAQRDALVGEARGRVEEMLGRAARAVEGFGGDMGEHAESLLQEGDGDEVMEAEEDAEDGGQAPQAETQLPAEPSISAVVSSGKQHDSPMRTDSGRRANSSAATPSSRRAPASSAHSTEHPRATEPSDPHDISTANAPNPAKDTNDVETDEEGNSQAASDGQGRSGGQGEAKGRGSAPRSNTPLESPPPPRTMLGSPKENRPPTSQPAEPASDSHDSLVVVTPVKPRQEGAESQCQVKVLGSHRQLLGSFTSQPEPDRLPASGRVGSEEDATGEGGGVDPPAGGALPEMMDLIKGQTAEEVFE